MFQNLPLMSMKLQKITIKIYMEKVIISKNIKVTLTNKQEKNINNLT